MDENIVHIKWLEARLDNEHENYLQVFRENMKLAARNVEFKALLLKCVEAMNEIPVIERTRAEQDALTAIREWRKQGK